MNQEKAQLIQIDIVRCSDREDCKTDDEEIYNYFAGRQMGIIKNQIRFD